MEKLPWDEMRYQIHNMQHKNKSKIDFNLLERIRQSDLLIISNGNDKFVGVWYLIFIKAPNGKEEYDFFLSFRCSSKLSYFYLRIAQQIGIPCIESISLTRLVCNELKTGECFTPEYFGFKTGVRFPRYKEQKDLSDFQQKIKEDLIAEVYILIKTHYKRITKKYLKTLELVEDKPDKDIKLELQKLAEEYSLSFRQVHNSQTGTDEYHLKSSIEEYDINFWQILFVQEKTKKIYVAAYGIFECFDINKAGSAIGLIKVLVDTDQKSLKQHVRKYYEEFLINQKLYEIATSSVEIILNLNSSKTGMEYRLDKSRTTVMTIYLKKSFKKVFVINISCNEFMRNPALFKKFIENPHRMNRWNFRCHERKSMPRTAPYL